MLFLFVSYKAEDRSIVKMENERLRGGKSVEETEKYRERKRHTHRYTYRQTQIERDRERRRDRQTGN